MALLRKGDLKLIRHLIGWHPARQKPGAILAQRGLGIFIAPVGAKRARDSIEDVGWGDEAVEMPILVMHESHRHLGLLKQVKGIQGVEGI
jgi:hypothetical protein